jgi:hypothetical protein
MFLYTPAAAGHYLEEMVEHLGRTLTDDEHCERLQRHRWELVGPTNRQPTSKCAPSG